MKTIIIPVNNITFTCIVYLYAKMNFGQRIIHATFPNIKLDKTVIIIIITNVRLHLMLDNHTMIEGDNGMPIKMNNYKSKHTTTTGMYLPISEYKEFSPFAAISTQVVSHSILMNTFLIGP